MQFGIHIPIFNELADARLLAGLASDAEAAGWDGFFLWDHIAGNAVDTWVALTAIALQTTRLRFGPLVTPLPRRRPWKVAREAASLDRLSGGRLILGVGSGGGGPHEWDNLGEETDTKARGAMLDESLDLLDLLWSGQTVDYTGQYYTVRDTRFTHVPAQRPRIPIWVAGIWPHTAPFRRAARWDGACPQGLGLGEERQMTPETIAEVAAYIAERRTATSPFDLVHEGLTSGVDRAEDAAIVAPYEAAGVTWWMENVNPWRYGWTGQGAYPMEKMHMRIRQGPPRL